MKPVVKSDAPKGSEQPSQFPRTQIPSRTVYGFPVSSNQFQILQESTPAASNSLSQSTNRLTDPRTTRLARQQAARREAEQGTSGNLANEGVSYIVPPMRDAQGTF